MAFVAIYARYSSDRQSEASIEDQARLCEERAAREGFQVVETYADRAISGASLLRPGLQALMADALAGRFTVLVAEALDRLSRDQADVAAIYKRLSFAGVRILTLSEGWIEELHVGLKGTMNQLFLKDLAAKNPARIARTRGGRVFGGRECIWLQGCPETKERRRTGDRRARDSLRRSGCRAADFCGLC